MPGPGSRAVPKPKPRLFDRIARKKQQDQQQATFRAEVWRRAGSQCERCGVKCVRILTLEPRQGHVHHKRRRNVAPDQKFNPANGELLCAVCHLKEHGQRL